MSQFDREAEREKLREQFDDDDDDQAATERMSELLLQGATMTNRHCGDCGNPVFRYDGREFCPACQQPADQPDGSADGATGDRGDRAAGTEHAAAGDDRPVATRDATDDGRQRPAAADPVETAGRSADAGDPDAGVDPDPAAAGVAPDRRTDGTADARGREPTAPEAAGAGSEAGLPAGRAALERTVTRLAREAEASDDLGRTRDSLAAAREAAEALAALKRASR